MTGNKKLWEKQYSVVVDNLWGQNSINTLVEYHSLVLDKGIVLDLGMGEGRNALYFASKGYETVGIDISETEVNRSLKYAMEQELNLTAKVENIINYPIEKNTYSLIILSNVLNFFKDIEIKEVIEKAKEGLVNGGLIYINVFDINDPGYEKSANRAQKVNDYTFYRPKSDSYIHFFLREELIEYFE